MIETETTYTEEEFNNAIELFQKVEIDTLDLKELIELGNAYDNRVSWCGTRAQEFIERTDNMKSYIPRYNQLYREIIINKKPDFNKEMIELAKNVSNYIKFLDEATSMIPFVDDSALATINIELMALISEASSTLMLIEFPECKSKTDFALSALLKRCHINSLLDSKWSDEFQKILLSKLDGYMEDPEIPDYYKQFCQNLKEDFADGLKFFDVK